MSCLTFIFHVHVFGRAHQGFGWVGEWANGWLVTNMNLPSLYLFDNSS